MTGKSENGMPMISVMGTLPGYIYCMLLSNMLVDMPLFGGALYLCGHAVIVFASVFGKRNRTYLPGYSRIWAVLLLAVLSAAGVLLAGIYPATLQNGNVWVMFAAAALCLCADGMTIRLSRLEGRSAIRSVRTLVTAGIIQVVVIAAMTWVLMHNIGWSDGWPLAAGFALMTIGNALHARHQRHAPALAEEDDGEQAPEIRKVKAYHTMEWISLLLVMAVELTTAVLYALLATNREWLFPAIAVAILCTLIPSAAGRWILRRLEKSGKKDPTWLLVTGLVLWLGGIILCSMMLRSGQLEYIRVYGYLSVCTIGGTLSLTGLGRIEEIMPDAVSVTGQQIQPGYWRLRNANWELARLLGDTLALTALIIFCFVAGKDLPQSTEELAARFQPVMMIPLILVVIGALVSAIRFPLSSRYIEKLKKFLDIREAGAENPALKRQLEHVVAEPYRQPYLARFLIAILRAFYRHKTVNADHIELDDSNPVVFLCNHGEIYGPIVCNLFIPVPIRTWTISRMMYDQAQVTEYVYENTFSKLTRLPLFVRKTLARFIGWLSVTVMNQIESIPVYRGSPMKLRETVRMSIEALEAGDNLLIFPESQDGIYERTGVGKISPGFLMLAEAYWKKTHKKMRMLPLYANKENRTVTFGTTVTYEPENGFQQEQVRVVEEVTAQILEMAGMDNDGKAAQAT